jgi:hypothetical protein
MGRDGGDGRAALPTYIGEMGSLDGHGIAGPEGSSGGERESEAQFENR